MKFNFRLASRIIGMLLIIMAAAMTLPIAVSIYYGDGSQFGLLLSAICILVSGLFLRNFIGAKPSNVLTERDGALFTALIWIVIPLFGALPYIFTSAVRSFTDAAFESFSGFTTTGSSILKGLDNLPQGLLVWRSMSQWVGGMGLILFVIALLRRLNEGSAHLYESEFSGTLQRRLHPRMSLSVIRMWAIYIGMTAALFGILMLCDNSLVDSLSIAMSTVSTGGFMTHDAGLSYMSANSIWVITLFMVLSGINLAVLFKFFTGRWRMLSGEEELWRYLLLYLVSAIVVALFFFIGERQVSEQTLLFSLFHVASTISSCGFYTDAPSVWPRVVSVVTFMLIFIGASSGSTGGGLKVKRIMILARHVRNYFTQMVHPHAVTCVKVDGKVVEEDYISKVSAFIFIYLTFVAFGAFVLTLCGIDIPNALCTAAANMGNLGPSPVLNNIGANLDYATLKPVAKYTMVSLMLAGRLEVFALIAAFTPAFWRRRR
ncbi:MAG: TrkH family potassium uptake protein [Bacteroidales bacterium]|nr:TrkH family potassium uptake protein [Bacteroidales bacterium]